MRIVLAFCIVGLALQHGARLEAAETETPRSPLTNWLTEELDYAMANLAMPDGTRPYYLAYTVTERQVTTLEAALGAPLRDQDFHRRFLQVDARVGDYELDSTHQIRGADPGFDLSDQLFGGAVEVSLSDNRDALQQAVWRATDRAFKSAAKRYQRVLTNRTTQVDEDDQSGDFTRETPAVHRDPPVPLAFDRDAWRQRLDRVSALARQHPLLYRSSVMLTGGAEHRWMVTSEGTRLETGRQLWRVMLSAGTKAEDGMELDQSFAFDAASEAGLPDETAIAQAFEGIIRQVLALRQAPLIEPFTGPAILRNRASGVFFHEIFGHRIEGHRQKDVEEGQTFARKVGQPILPGFLNVRDDPTLATFQGQDLRGYYRFDDEGVPAQNTVLVENGTLRTFLLSRSPLEGFPRSNGHGRREPGRDVVSRMGNLIVESEKQVPFAELRRQLLEECRRQGKPFGLLFEDIAGGFTGTRRMSAQSFKVLPVVVYRVFADGRPDELVRGVDIVGTPLTSFSKILAAGDDPAVFNGTCGAESGNVPVSAISPSILVAQIEVEKRRRQQDRPPLLPSPLEAAAVEATPDGEILFQALTDELDRARTLEMPGLDRPYFIQYRVEDSLAHTLTAADGALLSSYRTRQRELRTQVRVGSFELDNTNFADGGFGFGNPIEQASLPLTDDYRALRHALWLATDRDYKNAVETLTRKRAYLRDKHIVDRPPDFSAAPPIRQTGPPARLEFDEAAWRIRLSELSARFLRFPEILESGVQLVAGAQDLYFVNSEGTRLRVPDTGAVLAFSAQVQAPDGMRLSDGRFYAGRTVADLPSMQTLLQDVEALVTGLRQRREAEVLERYAGPVLFDALAGPQLIYSLLGEAFAGRPEAVGETRRPATLNLEARLGTRLFPASFRVWDDPTQVTHQGETLVGHYLYDDEAVAAARLDLVTDGRLTALCRSRAPLRKLSGSTGHARSPANSAPQAHIANLFIEDQKGLSPEDLKTELLAAARDEGLEFALRVTTLQVPGAFSSRPDLIRYFNRPGAGEPGRLGDPVGVYKVSVKDGQETPVRGLEFAPVEVRALRHIVAAGLQPRVFNHVGFGYVGITPPVAVIAPPLLFDDLELQRIREEFDALPLLPPPRARR